MKSSLFRIVLLLCTGLALYLATLGSAAPALAEPGGLDSSKIDPALLQAMNANPNGLFWVLVETELPSKKPAAPSAPKGRPAPPAAPTKNQNAERAQAAVDRLKVNGAKAVKSLAIVGGAAGTLSANGVAKLSRDPFVARILLDRQLRPLGTPAANSIYTQVVHAPEVWTQGINGRGVSVAILDSGIASVHDLTVPSNRIIASVDLTPSPANGDPGGHGTHVAGIVGGNGADSAQAWMGIAPGANLINVRVIGAEGSTNVSTVIRGIEWVVQNRRNYNIRVMNLSLGGVASHSYRNDPLAAAVEVAWHSGIVVVVAAGNEGSRAGTILTPGTDPYVITVGALDDSGTVANVDDSIASFSSRGPTLDGFHKPDLLAPGRRIVSLRSPGSVLDSMLPLRVTATNYFRLSGTSMASPVVAGTSALVIQKNPGIKPNQVKALLKQTARQVTGGNADSAGAGLVDARGAVSTAVPAPANRGLRPSDGFIKAVYPLLYGMPLANIWRDPGLGGLNWRNITWDNITWDNITWDNITWDNITWDNITWSNITWDNITWDNITWDSSVSADAVRVDSVGWQGVAGID